MYAIQIPFDGDWLYVTEGVDLAVKLFDSEDLARQAALIWSNYRVVQYQTQ